MANDTSNANGVNIDAVDLPSYQATGFNQASGANMLKQEVANTQVDDASIRQKAEQQYKATYDIEQRGLSTQLSALIKAQTDDADLLNTQYQQSINTMMAKLAKRGLSVGATPQATTAALNRFKNEVMTQRQTAYNVQQQGVQALVDTHKANYELNVQARANEIKNNSLKSLNDLLTQMAQLQSSSFESYINYLLSKKKNSFDAQSIQIARDNIALDEQSIGIDKEKIGLEKESVALDAESIALDKQFIKLQYSGSSGGSSGGSRRSSGGRRSSGSGSSSSSSSSSNPLSSGYFKGSGSSKKVSGGALAKAGAKAVSSKKVSSGGSRRLAIAR